ncbi:MAG: hypothetical protein H0Z33_02670 [Bacillaceae bacterium]|nr:hypothetical protein [Bacillaceae bacterium]
MKPRRGCSKSSTFLRSSNQNNQTVNVYTSVYLTFPFGKKEKRRKNSLKKKKTLRKKQRHRNVLTGRDLFSDLDRGLPEVYFPGENVHQADHHHDWDSLLKNREPASDDKAGHATGIHGSDNSIQPDHDTDLDDIFEGLEEPSEPQSNNQDQQHDDDTDLDDLFDDLGESSAPQSNDQDQQHDDDAGLDGLFDDLGESSAPQSNDQDQQHDDDAGLDGLFDDLGESSAPQSNDQDQQNDDDTDMERYFDVPDNQDDSGTDTSETENRQAESTEQNNINDRVAEDIKIEESGQTELISEHKESPVTDTGQNRFEHDSIPVDSPAIYNQQHHVLNVKDVPVKIEKELESSRKVSVYIFNRSELRLEVKLMLSPNNEDYVITDLCHLDQGEQTVLTSQHLCKKGCLYLNTVESEQTLPDVEFPDKVDVYFLFDNNSS